MAEKMGRPTEYNETVLDKVREYLEECTDENIQLVKQSNEEKGYEMYENKLKVKIPTIEGLAVYLGIHKDTVYDWEKKYKDFSDLIGDLRAIQADRLINNGLSGDYNPTISKVLLTKHGYREGIEQTGNEGTPLNDNIADAIKKVYGPTPESTNNG